MPHEREPRSEPFGSGDGIEKLDRVVLSDELVDKARQRIDQVYGPDKRWHRKMQQQEPDMLAIIQAPGAYENLRPVQRMLKDKKTIGDVWRWATDDSLEQADRAPRLAGLRAFAAGLDDAISSSGSRQETLTDEQQKLTAVSSELFYQANEAYESTRKPRSGQLSESKIPLAKHIPRVSKNIEYQSDTRERDVTPVSTERNRDRQDRGDEVARGGRWKLGFEQMIGDVDHDKLIAQRKEFLSRVLDESATETDAVRAWSLTRQLLQRMRERPEKSGMLQRQLDQPGTYLRAIDLLNRLERGSDSITDLTRESSSMLDLKALRLIGSGCLEAGYGQFGATDFSDLPPRNKQLVRMGEVIGLEAEAGMIHRMVENGTLTKEKAKAAQMRYMQLAHSDDIPDMFRERFAVVEKTLRDQFGLSELQFKKEEKPAEPGQPVAQGEASEVLHEQSEEHFKSLLRPYLPIEGTPERVQVDRFVEDFTEHIDYARYVGEADGVGDVVAAWVERVFHRPALHGKVFGWRGGLRSIFAWKRANKEMAEVRGRVQNVLDRYKDVTGDTQFAHYETLLAAANRAELPEGEEPTLEMEEIIREDIADEPETSTGQGPETPSVAEKNDQEFLQDIQNTVIAHEGRRNFFEFAMEHPGAPRFKQIAESRGKKPEELWDEIVKGFVDGDVGQKREAA